MKKLTIIFALFLTGLMAQANLAQEKPNERELFIKASRFLEEKPFDKQAKDVRAWAVRWAVETKEVTVILCGGKIPEAILDKKAKFGTELVGQYLIAMTAFKLQNPANKDENAAQLAGLESIVRTYQTMLKENPKAKTEKLDNLVTQSGNGELEKMVTEADCGKK